MSPARLSIEELPQVELSFQRMWSDQPNKKQKMQPNNEIVDMFDDIEALWETKWKSAVSKPNIRPGGKLILTPTPHVFQITF